MKSLLLVLLFPFLNFSKTDRNVFGGHKLTIQEAERILGETCQLKESGNETKVGGHKYKSTHIGHSNSNHALYFIFESYESETVAIKTFDNLRDTNQTFEGF